MTNADLAKELLNEADLMAVNPQRVPTRTLEMLRKAAAAIEALEASLSTIEAATVERCAAEIRAKCQACNGTGHQGQDQCPYCGYPIDAIRALAPLDTEAMEPPGIPAVMEVRRIGAAIAAPDTGSTGWTEKERAAINSLMESQELSERAVIRQALANYQMIIERERAGETCTWSGDAQRALDFYNPGEK